MRIRRIGGWNITNKCNVLREYTRSVVVVVASFVSAHHRKNDDDGKYV